MTGPRAPVEGGVYEEREGELVLVERTQPGTDGVAPPAEEG